MNTTIIGKLRTGNINNIDDLQALLIGLTRVKLKGNETWSEADIIASITNNSSFFALGENNDSIVFYIRDKQLWLWTAYSDKANAIVYYYDDIKDLAKLCNCTSIGFNSKRKGYEKRMEFLKATISRVEYTINLLSY